MAKKTINEIIEEAKRKMSPEKKAQVDRLTKNIHKKLKIDLRSTNSKGLKVPRYNVKSGITKTRNLKIAATVVILAQTGYIVKKVYDAYKKNQANKAMRKTLGSAAGIALTIGGVKALQYGASKLDKKFTPFYLKKQAEAGFFDPSKKATLPMGVFMGADAYQAAKKGKGRWVTVKGRKLFIKG